MISRLGIIGDVHAEDELLSLTLAHLKNAGVDALVCTGDIADGTGDVDRCCALLAEHGVYTVRGNHDRWLMTGKVRHIPDAHLAEDLQPGTQDYLLGLPTQLTLSTINGPLLLCHGVADNDLQKIWPGTSNMPIDRCTTLDQIIADGAYRYMINGHVHYRTVINFRQLTLLNAGTLKNRHRPGFSILDCESRTLSGFECVPRVSKVRELTLHHPERRIFTDTRDFDGDWQPVTLYA
jgi:predicted phosphodiesterase